MTYSKLKTLMANNDPIAINITFHTFNHKKNTYGPVYFRRRLFNRYWVAVEVDYGYTAPTAIKNFKDKDLAADYAWELACKYERSGLAEIHPLFSNNKV